MPSRVLLTIASSDEETMAASCADSRAAAEYRSVVSSHGIGATPLHLRYLLSAVADIDAKFLAARFICEPAACTGNDARPVCHRSANATIARAACAGTTVLRCASSRWSRLHKDQSADNGLVSAMPMLLSCIADGRRRRPVAGLVAIDATWAS